MMIRLQPDDMSSKGGVLLEKVVLITGGTSGIGLNTARVLSEKGCRVYEFSRREKGTDAAIHIQADVTDEPQLQRAVQKRQKPPIRTILIRESPIPKMKA